MSPLEADLTVKPEVRRMNVDSADITGQVADTNSGGGPLEAVVAAAPSVGFPRKMAYCGFPGAAAREALWEHYIGLLDRGVSSDRILVLLDSSTRTLWSRWLKGEALGGSRRVLDRPTGGQRVHTPGAWIQQELALWWPLVDERLNAEGHVAAGPDGVFASPLFVSVDVAQYVLRHFTRRRRQGDRADLLVGLRTPPFMQNVQLLDALARGLEHGIDLFSDPAAAVAAIAGRLAAGEDPILAERGIPAQVGAVLALYIAGSLRCRTFDQALQLALYTEILAPDPRYMAHFHEAIGHLLVENLDESTPRHQALYRQWLAGGVAGYFTLQADQGGRAGHPFEGGLREYMGGDPRGAWAMAATMCQVVPDTISAEPPLAPLGRALHDALHGEVHPLMVDPERLFMRLDDYALPEMLVAVGQEVGRLLASGVPPGEIALVAPALNPLLIWSLRERLAAMGGVLYVFAGSNRPTDYRPVRLLTTLARLCYEGAEPPASRFEMLELLEFVSGVNPLALGQLIGQLCPAQVLVFPDDPAALEAVLGRVGLARYQTLVSWIAAQRGGPDVALDAFFPGAFAAVYAAFRQGEYQTPAQDEAWQREISQVGQLIELARRFQAADARLSGHVGGAAGAANRFLEFLRECPVSERPFFAREPHRNAVMLATASQFAEKGFVEGRLRHLFLLDVGSTDWWKPDRRELTNPRVLSHAWPGRPYTIDDEVADTNAKLGRVLMASCLKVSERLWVYGCLADEAGRENEGELPWIFASLVGRKGVAR